MNRIKRVNIKSKKWLIFVISFGLFGVIVLSNTYANQEDPRSSLPAVRSFGIFPGFGNERGLQRHESIEREMGRKIQNADGFLSLKSESGFNSTSWGLFEAPDAMFCKRPDITVNLGVPLNFGPGSNNLTPERLASNRQGLQATARGERDSSYRKLGERLMECGQKNAILRIASEMDIPWNAYTMVGNEDVFKEAFRHVVRVLRATPGNNFKIDYMGNGDFNRSYTTRTGQETTRAEAAFPGAQYVDIIGIDVYNRKPWNIVKAKLDYAQSMAKKYGKPMSIPEWGLWVDETGDDPQFIQNMYDWMNSTPRTGPGALYYNAYFYDYIQSRLERAPKSKALFNKLFGVPVSNPKIPSSNSSAPSTPTPSPTPPAPNPTPEPLPTVPTAEADLPDVIIESGSVKTIPANPVAGEEVKFSVSIKNIGAGSTPQGIIHGVSFWVDGKNVAWSDSSTSTLKPGESRTLITNGGSDGNATWTATAGSNTVEARWDDIRRMEESNRNNNTRSLAFTVTEQAPEPEPTQSSQLPNVVIVPGSIKTIPEKPVAGQEVFIQATIRNDGAGATPEGIKHGVSFWLSNNTVIAWSDDSLASLAPGATRVLTSNGGFDGNATWTATEGTSTIIAKWDDVNPPRFTESDDIKDIQETTINVGAASPTPPPTPTDSAAPTLTITSPTANAVLSGTQIFAATAQDDIGVTKVEIYFNNSSQPAATDVIAPFRFSWNTARVADGSYLVKMRAYDASGKTTDKTINLTVKNTADPEQPTPNEPSTPTQPEQPAPAPSPTPPPTNLVQADANQDGKIDIFDLALVLFNFNKPASSSNKGDVNNDGVINIFDLILILNEWSQ